MALKIVKSAENYAVSAADEIAVRWELSFSIVVQFENFRFYVFARAALITLAAVEFLNCWIASSCAAQTASTLAWFLKC